MQLDPHPIKVELWVAGSRSTLQPYATPTYEDAWNAEKEISRSCRMRLRDVVRRDEVPLLQFHAIKKPARLDHGRHTAAPLALDRQPADGDRSDPDAKLDCHAAAHPELEDAGQRLSISERVPLGVGSSRAAARLD